MLLIQRKSIYMIDIYEYEYIYITIPNEGIYVNCMLFPSIIEKC